MRIRGKLPLLVLLVFTAWVLTRVSLPLYSVEPGPVREVQPLIAVAGHETYPAEGLIMTAVEVRQLSPLDMVIAWVDPARDVIPESDLRSPGESPEQEDTRLTSQMDQSKIDAIYVVLRELTDYPQERGRGSLVESVVPGCPAGEALAPGDVILSIDGEDVGSRRDAARAIDGTPEGRSIEFTVRGGGETRDVDLSRELCAGHDEPIVGVSLIDAFPFRVRVRSGDVGGPSAGLMYALGLYDLLTPGELAGGRTVAGTGVITLDGGVQPIGGIRQKIIAAERAGADMFLLPRGNLEEASGVGVNLRLVPVETFEDALSSLGPAAGS